MQQARITAQKRWCEPRRNMFCRALLRLLALCIADNSVVATVCTTNDANSTAHVQVTQGDHSNVSLSAPGTAIEADCCIFCRGCGHGGGCCSHPITPLYLIPSIIPPSLFASSIDTTRDQPCPRLAAESLRPPIAS